MMNATTSSDVQQALDQLVEDGQWDLLSRLLPTASELAARRIVDRLVAGGQFEVLACTTCLRRQPRHPGLEADFGRPARPMLRDFEAEEDIEGIPEHIMADAQEISAHAAQRREVSMRKAAQIDHDPIRDLIIKQLAARLPESGPGEALLTIAKACPFAHTQREAAMKLANHEQWIKQLAATGRTADLIAISSSARLDAVTKNLARVMGKQFSELQQSGDQAALNFIGQHHPDGEVKGAARDALA